MTATATRTLTDSEMDAMLVRVQKLLALAQSPNEHEASLAATKAQELLFKYNLTLTQVDSRSQAGKSQDIRDKYNNNTIDLGVARGQVTNWRRDLLFIVARHNFCRALSWSGRPLMQLIGEPHNIQAVVQMFHYLAEAIDGLSDQAWTDVKAANGGKAPLTWHETPKVYGWHPQHAKQYRSSFSHGAVTRIGQRLYEMREALRKETDATMALVVVKDAELNEAVDAFYSKVSNRSVQRVGVDAGAYAAGRKAADKIGLEPQVSGSGSHKAING